MQCTCGKAYRVKDEFAGKKIRCSACKIIVVVPLLEAEDDAVNFLLTEDPGLKVAPVKSRPVDDEEPRPRKDERITSNPAPWPKTAPPEKPSRVPKRKKRLSESEDRASYGPAFVISPTVATGALMMIGAVVWFFGALIFLDRIFFYPPIMFVLGIGALFRGLTGQED